MYIPEQFREQDIGVLQDFVEQFDFATLITQQSGEIIASHLPFLLDRTAGRYGTLRAHVARRNPQFEQLQSAGEALVIFQGPHSYISPMWYADQSNVPTWNYVVVHAYGTPRILEEPDLIELLRALVAKHEEPPPRGWEFDPEQPRIKRMLTEIGGFEIPISTLQGKFKLNQNRTAADRKGVIDTLSKSEDALQQAIANLMTAGGP
jgi:transcriptional regulator